MEAAVAAVAVGTVSAGIASAMISQCTIGPGVAAYEFANRLLQSFLGRLSWQHTPMTHKAVHPVGRGGAQRFSHEELGRGLDAARRHVQDEEARKTICCRRGPCQTQPRSRKCPNTWALRVVLDRVRRSWPAEYTSIHATGPVWPSPADYPAVPQGAPYRRPRTGRQ